MRPRTAQLRAWARGRVDKPSRDACHQSRRGGAPIADDESSACSGLGARDDRATDKSPLPPTSEPSSIAHSTGAWNAAEIGKPEHVEQ